MRIRPPIPPARGRPRLRRLGWAAVWAALACGFPSARAQVSGQPCSQQSGYSIKDLSTGRTVSRGWTSPNGTISDGVALGANKTYQITIANARNGTIGSATFTTGNNGSTLSLPSVQIGQSVDRDSDGDGLNDDIEGVFGTDPFNKSTVGQGILDSVIATTPPPPGTPAGPGGTIVPGGSTFGPPGIIAGVLLPGTCVDVCAFRDTVALACLDRGVAFFNVFGGMTPRQFALVDTPGEARAVGCPGDDCPVADGPAGLAIIDLRNPATTHIRAQVTLGSYAESVASAAGIAYVGLRNGQLVTVDLASGTELQRLNLGAEVFDVVISGDFVWAISGNNLRSFTAVDGLLSPLGTVPLAGFGPDPLSNRKRLFVGGGWAQATCMNGFDNVNVSNPAAMFRVGMATATGPASYKHLVSDGSGLGLGCVGVNPRNDGTHDVYLFDLTDPTKVNNLITILATPGIAYANVIHNGVDYVADGANGLQVVRFLETDRKGIPPKVTLASSAVAGVAQEGKALRVTANATDDVQVRNVEFYVDGQLIDSDGNFPFEVFLNTPLSTPAKPTFTVRARAYDTGGNSTWSDPLTIGLGPDTTSPQVARTQPAANVILGRPTSVIAFFSEPLRPDSVVPGAFQLVNAGPDGLFGTADDLAAPSGALAYQDSLKAAVWTFPDPLPPGRWQATVGAPVADRAGNVLMKPYQWTFRVFDQPDRDHDGVPDALEVLLGLDPDNPDSKGDGIRDGDRDFDNDGLSNAWEVYYGLDPLNRFSRNPLIKDGDLDLDGDGLSNLREQAAGTNPLVADTDGDGWNDEAEVSAGSNPLDPNSRPSMLVVGGPAPLTIGLVRVSTGDTGLGMVVARPTVTLGLPAFTPGVMGGVVVGQPTVRIGLTGSAAGLAGALTVARPPVSLGLPSLSAVDSPGLTVGQPPLKTKFGTQ